jgi:hypothetical protein
MLARSGLLASSGPRHLLANAALEDSLNQWTETRRNMLGRVRPAVGVQRMARWEEIPVRNSEAHGNACCVVVVAPSGIESPKPVLHAHVLKRILELRSAAATYSIGSAAEGKNTTEAAMVATKDKIKDGDESLHKSLPHRSASFWTFAFGECWQSGLKNFLPSPASP